MDTKKAFLSKEVIIKNEDQYIEILNKLSNINLNDKWSRISTKNGINNEEIIGNISLSDFSSIDGVSYKDGVLTFTDENLAKYVQISENDECLITDSEKINLIDIVNGYDLPGYVLYDHDYLGDNSSYNDRNYYYYRYTNWYYTVDADGTVHQFADEAKTGGEFIDEDTEQSDL